MGCSFCIALSFWLCFMNFAFSPQLYFFYYWGKVHVHFGRQYRVSLHHVITLISWSPFTQNVHALLPLQDICHCLVMWRRQWRFIAPLLFWWSPRRWIHWLFSWWWSITPLLMFVSFVFCADFVSNFVAFAVGIEWWIGNWRNCRHWMIRR